MLSASKKAGNMQESNPQTAYDYVMQTYPRGKDYTRPITNTCNRPSRAVTIDMYTNCMLCVCDGWLPNTVGEITDFERLEDIWNNPIAKIIQEDVGAKKFTWCAVDHCGIKFQNNIEPMYQLVFGIDDSCNLHCPSCRRDQRMHTTGPLFDKKLNAVKHTVKLLEAFEPKIHIVLACSGDPLASHIYRPLIHSYKSKPSQTFTLFTNGLLLKKQLEKASILDSITRYWISIDAGSAEVYSQVRYGGDWKILMDNLEFLANNKRPNVNVSLFYVLQKKNYRDVFNFAKLCEQFGFHGHISQLDDWGTWNAQPTNTPDIWTIKNGIYADHNVLDPLHPEWQICRETIVELLKTTPPQVVQLTPQARNLLNLL
jgi:pyruvate-formate lyase-activating enzyme